MNKAHLYTALTALLAFAAVAYVQKNHMKAPVIGAYLPGGA